MYGTSVKAYMENFAIQTSEEQYEKFIRDVEAVQRVNQTPAASSRGSMRQPDQQEVQSAQAQTGGPTANYPFRDNGATTGQRHATGSGNVPEPKG